MKIPIGILTYQRPEYFRATLESFVNLNYQCLDQFIFVLLVQGVDNETAKIAHEFYELFDKMIIRDDNKGCAWGYSKVSELCLAYDEPLVMHLQDDWLSTEPMTAYLDGIKAAFDAHENVGIMRLRSNKEKVCDRSRITSDIIKYRSAFPHEKYCNVLTAQHQHYTFNPTIIRASVLKKLLPFTKEHDAMKRYHELNLAGSQLRANCFRHIGNNRATSNVKGGKEKWVK